MDKNRKILVSHANAQQGTADKDFNSKVILCIHTSQSLYQDIIDNAHWSLNGVMAMVAGIEAMLELCNKSSSNLSLPLTCQQTNTEFPYGTIP